MRSVSISGRAGFIGSHVTNFYLGSMFKNRLLLTIFAPNLSKIQHTSSPRLPPSDMLLDEYSSPALLVIERGIGSNTLK